VLYCGLFKPMHLG